MPELTPARPRRREVWLVRLGAANRGEIGKTRPALVVSVDGLQTGTPYDRITVVPLTSNPRQQPNRLQPALPASDGINHPSVILCDAPRAIVPSRFLQHIGTVCEAVFEQVIEARSVIEGWDD